MEQCWSESSLKDWYFIILLLLWHFSSLSVHIAAQASFQKEKKEAEHSLCHPRVLEKLNYATHSELKFVVNLADSIKPQRAASQTENAQATGIILRDPLFPALSDWWQNNGELKAFRGQKGMIKEPRRNNTLNGAGAAIDNSDNSRFSTWLNSLSSLSWDRPGVIHRNITFESNYASLK